MRKQFITNQKEFEKDHTLRSFFAKLRFYRHYFRLLSFSLNRFEKITLIVLGWVFLISVMGLGLKFYLNHSHIIPKTGGSYTEGIIGKPKYLNPLLCQTNDADRDLCALIFSGLVKYNQERQIEGDLAKSWKVDEHKKVYTFTLKDNLSWQDGVPLTAEDIVFTVNLIQHPDYPGTLKTSWNNVRVKAISNRVVRFYLKDSYAEFLSNVTLGILPKHIWEEIPPQNLLTAKPSLNPVGSGPYAFQELQSKEDVSLTTVRLKRFEQYRGNQTYLDKVTLKFYPDQDKLKMALSKKEIDSTFDLKGADVHQLAQKSGFTEYHFTTPQYLAVFLNQEKSDLLEDSRVRKALNFAIDRKKIIQEVFSGEANLIHSPILSHFPGFRSAFAQDIYNPRKARKLLAQAGWKINPKTHYLEKAGRKLSFNLVTSDQEEFVLIAEGLRRSWEKIGIQLNLHIYTLGAFQQEQIRPRDYQALLFGENLGPDSDLYPFWHSTQVNDPGLNLALFRNTQLDRLLESARQTSRLKQKVQDYRKLFQIFENEVPAIFLVNPTKNYLISNKIKGVKTGMVVFPADRFYWIGDFYVRGQREWGKG